MQTDDNSARIAVIGATGRVGSPLVEILEQRGHHVVPIARSTGVDVISGEGLHAAQFHEFVDQLVGWTIQDGVAHLPEMRTQLVAARVVADAVADAAAALFASRGDALEIREIRGPDDPDAAA